MTARVIEAGVGHPVGVFGRKGMLVMRPQAISSESRTGVRRVFSGLGPAPEIPGTTERRVLARMLQKRGLFGEIPGSVVTNGIDTSLYASIPAEHQGFLATLIRATGEACSCSGSKKGWRRKA
jgi:hypothetical protein